MSLSMSGSIIEQAENYAPLFPVQYTTITIFLKQVYIVGMLPAPDYWVCMTGH